MAASYAPNFTPGGELPNEATPMETDEQTRTGKRNKPEQENGNNQPESNNQEQQETSKTIATRLEQEPDKKKPYSGHGIRRNKTLLRMDFLNATTPHEAYRQWKTILHHIQTIDKTTTIHTNDKKTFLTATETLPTETELTAYTEMEATQKRHQNTAAYACITMVATARPIHEMKRTQPTLIQKLQEQNVYLRSTSFNTTETTEIGFFIGLHPSLTNLQWRTTQISKALGHIDQVPSFQIYRRKLQEGDTTTSCIVVRCAKKDVQDLQTRLMTVQPNALGKGVDYIPYSAVSVWTQTDYLNTYRHQNQFIQDMGAIAIQGIPTAVMEDDSQMGPTIKQYLLANEDIISIEKSDMPNANKWWILTPKTKLNDTWAYLNEDFSQYMQQNPLNHEYMAPGDIPTKHAAQTTQTTHANQYTSALLMRLNARTQITIPRNHPPQTGRVRSYATVTQPVTVGPTQTQSVQHSNSLELREIKAALTSLKSQDKAAEEEKMKDIKFAITELKTAATLTTSTLTNTAGEKENLLRELTEKQDQQYGRITQHQDQQMDKMLESFQKFIREMMRDMFAQISSQMNSLLTSLLPMITSTQPQRSPPTPQYQQQQFSHPMQQMNPQLVTFQNPPMHPGGHLSTVVPTPS